MISLKYRRPHRKIASVKIEMKTVKLLFFESYVTDQRGNWKLEAFIKILTNSLLNVSSFEIHTSAALDYLKITHLPPHEIKDNFKSLKYSITSTTLKRHIGVNIPLKQNPQEGNPWSTSTGTGLAPVLCHQTKNKATFTNNHSQAINTLHLHFKAPAATLKLSSSSEQSNTYHQWVLPLILLTPSSFHLKYPKMCQSINNRLAKRLVLANCKFLWREIQNYPTTILPINP